MPATLALPVHRLWSLTQVRWLATISLAVPPLVVAAMQPATGVATTVAMAVPVAATVAELVG